MKDDERPLVDLSGLEFEGGSIICPVCARPAEWLVILASSPVARCDDCLKRHRRPRPGTVATQLELL